jgi:sugar lactone lactonase YvrE
MTKSARLISCLCAAACVLSATQTRTWTQDDYSDFEKGDLKRLSVSSDGRLHLAPLFRELLDSSSVYLWALAEDSKGNLYAGGGGPGGPGGASIYVIAPNGKSKTLAQLDELEVHAIAIDRNDRVYAGTAPDGKVYRLTSTGKPEVFFDPKAKYIWGMAFDSQGDLFVATGDRGEIYRVTPDGKGKVFYKTSETHARSLAVDASDNLIVGTEPGGLIIRVSPKGEGFVLYQAAKREITAIAIAKNGSIYVAGVGNRTGASQAGFAATGGRAAEPAPALASPQPGPAPGGQITARPAAAPAPAATPLPPAPIAGGSEVYRIDKDGFPHRVWSHAQQIAYAIGFDAEQRPIIGTGNKGIIYRLDSDLIYTELLNTPPTQVTALYAGPSGKIYAGTGNVGQVYQIGPGLEKEGVIESDVLDSGMFSYWGRLSFHGSMNGGRIAVDTRSGNLDRPQNDWSPWSAPITSPEGARVTSPAARFLQWRAVLHAAPSGNSPELRSVDVAYLPKNVAPEVQQIEITPPNYRFPPQAQLTLSSPQTLSLPPLGRPARTPSANLNSDSGGSSMQYAKGYIGARWNAFDENGDSLLYTVQIRGENETEWKPLKEKLTDRHLSWDSTAFPDGDYRIRVIASDEPGNPPDQALKGELVSDAFTIDNTPPVISGLTGTAGGNQIAVRWKAADALSLIDKAEYSVNGGDWILVEPTTRLTDSREEEYAISIPRPSPGEQTIAVRVTDEFDNQAVAKVVVK